MEDSAEGRDESIKAILIDFERVQSVDFTAMTALKEQLNTMHDQGVTVGFCKVNLKVEKKMKSIGIKGQNMHNDMMQVLEGMLIDLRRDNQFIMHNKLSQELY